MTRNYRVYTKAHESSPWKDTGIIESNRDLANAVWSDICRKLGRHSFKLEPISYGVEYAR